MKLTKRENDVALLIAKGITIILFIFVYILRLIFTTLYKFKRSLYQLALLILAVYLPLTLASNVVYAPRAEAVLNGYNYVASPTTEHQKIINYIDTTFGSYAPRAFQLLTQCGENHALNPLALNDNTQWGGVGKDYGVFQLNNVYQKVTNTNFLFDYKTNIDMAWIIFKNSGYNFHLWTGGRHCGI